MIRVTGLIVAAVVLTASASASAQDLNLSRDLQRLGISANMEPNHPEVDSRPLFQQAIDYVQRRHVARVVLDPGDYFFLTPQQPRKGSPAAASSRRIPRRLHPSAAAALGAPVERVAEQPVSGRLVTTEFPKGTLL